MTESLIGKRRIIFRKSAVGSLLAAHFVMSEQPSSVWVSMGLFVAIALVSQVVQKVSMRTNRREEEPQIGSMRTNRGEQEAYDSQAFAEDLPRAGNHQYYMKRMYHELSYKEMNFALGSLEDDGAKSQVAANMESVRNSRVFDSS